MVGFKNINGSQKEPEAGLVFREVRMRPKAGKMLEIRQLERDEIEKVGTIDRGEWIDGVYYHQNGGLVLKPETHDVKGWGPGQMDSILPDLQACFGRGGLFWGAFDGDQLAGIAVLDSQFLGPEGDMLQLKFLHVSRPYRKTGLGKTLFMRAAETARTLGAARLYVSATPSQNTIHFYQRLGCVVLAQPDPYLFELEPEDIHFEYKIPITAGLSIPKIESHFPKFMEFVRQMAGMVGRGEFNGWSEIIIRVNRFFNPEMSAKMDRLVPGWAKMASYQMGRTQTHTVCVLIALYNLPEFAAASPEMQSCYEWIGLLHDIAKKPPAEGGREHIHAFTSAALAAPVLAAVGFPVTNAYPDLIADWQKRVRSAVIFDDQMAYPDNTQLPEILAGIDNLFGVGSFAALILKTILLHLSFSWIADWPSAAPLSDDLVREFVDENLQAALRVMAWMDTDAWALFDAATRQKYHSEIQAFWQIIAPIIDKG